jgi:glycerophosphoryl diester phosphodiesterase
MRRATLQEADLKLVASFSPTNASSRAQPFFRRSEGSRVEHRGSPRQIPRPAATPPPAEAEGLPESAGPRDDASGAGEIHIEPRHLLLLGHRGARAVRTIQENTVKSFDRALADGCDGFEFDVRLSRDRIAVICHDPRSAGIEIAEASTDQLPQLARLEEVFERYQKTAFLDIELKVAGLDRIIVELLKKFPPQRGYVISSFLPEVLQAVYAIDSKIPLGLICESHPQLSHWKRAPIEYVIPRRDLVSVELIREIKAAGRKIFVWTVNDSEEMERFREWGVDGMISDETRLLCQTLSE